METVNLNPQPITPQSQKNSLNLADMKQWAKETIIFSSPAIIIFLTTYQAKGDWHIALGAAYSAILTSLINLFSKYKNQS
jgi:hypothetical protein